MTAAATDAKPGRHLAVFGRVAALPGLGQQQRSALSDVGPLPCRSTNASLSGNNARTWADGSAARMARPLAVRWAGSRTPTSVTSGGRPGSTLLDDVQHVATVQHGQVRGLADPVGERRQRPPG